MLQSINFRNPSLNNIDANICQTNSQVETTIRDYHPTSTPENKNKSLVKGGNGTLYSKNPANDYISRFADGFNDFLCCGSSTHFFKVFLEKDNSEM